MNKKDIPRQALALFDFDGTITEKDSFMEFLKHAVGKPKLYAGFFLLSPLLAAYMAGLFSASKMKELVMALYFKNHSADELMQMGESFAAEKLDALIFPSAMERIEWHRQHSHRVIIVSASFYLWLTPWCKKNNLELIATRLQMKNNRFTGKLHSPNCKGQEKVNRIKELLNPDDYSYIYAYGNSSGDAEMLKLADEKFYKHFQ
jgi:phosphatidylglycerophosphatase C